MRPGDYDMDDVEKSLLFETLVGRLDPTAKLPRRFDLWSEKLQTAWLKQHQLPSRLPSHKKTKGRVVGERERRKGNGTQD